MGNENSKKQGKSRSITPNKIMMDPQNLNLQKFNINNN